MSMSNCRVRLTNPEAQSAQQIFNHRNTIRVGSGNTDRDRPAYFTSVPSNSGEERQLEKTRNAPGARESEVIRITRPTGRQEVNITSFTSSRLGIDNNCSEAKKELKHFLQHWPNAQPGYSR
jgi:hypothetical protein